MRILRKHIGYLATLWFIAVVAVSYNSFANRHVHFLDNGIVINHAHPYERGELPQEVPNHSHSKFQLLFLDNISSLNLIFFAFILGLSLIRKVENFLFIPLIPLQGRVTCKFCFDRGPPSTN